jgi:hypothetical protein
MNNIRTIFNTPLIQFVDRLILFRKIIILNKASQLNLVKNQMNYKLG